MMEVRADDDGEVKSEIQSGGTESGRALCGWSNQQESGLGQHDSPA